MSANRFASEELIIEVASWIERVAKECNLAAPFRGKVDGIKTTTTSVFFGPREKREWTRTEIYYVGLMMPLSRLMRHCSLTEEQALEAVELASTQPDDSIEITVVEHSEEGQLIRLARRCKSADAFEQFLDDFEKSWLAVFQEKPE